MSTIEGPITRRKFRYPVDAALPANRVATIDDSGKLALAGATDERIGYTHDKPDCGVTLYEGCQDVLPRSYPDVVKLTVAAGNTFARRTVGYQAASGTIATTGTLRVGVAIASGGANSVIEIVPG